MKRTNGFQLERAPAGGQTLPPWAAALCGGLCAAGALTLLAGSFPVLPAWAALLLGLLLGAGLALLPQRAWLTPALCGAAALFCPEDLPLSRIEASSSCSVLFFPFSAVDDLLARDPACRNAYLRFLSGRIRFLNRKICCFTAGSAQRRLSLWLAAEEHDTVTLPGSLSSLAELLDIGRASLYRALDRLTDSGAITRNGRQITIISRELLTKELE